MGACHRVDILLVRHGITEWNQQRRYLGHTNQGVVKSELHQMDKLKSVLQEKRFDHVFTSDLNRCQETLAYFHLPSQVIIDHRLREMNFGDWEGKTYNELKYEVAYQNWLDHWEASPVPNGESAVSFKARVDSFIDELFQIIDSNNYANQQYLLVTHGGVIRYLVSRFVSSMSFWKVSIKHGYGIQLTFERQKGEWTCSSFLEVPLREKESS